MVNFRMVNDKFYIIYIYIYITIKKKKEKTQ